MKILGVKAFILYIVLLLSAPVPSASFPEQTEKSIAGRNSELEKLNKSISTSRKKLSSIKIKEKSTLKTLSAYQKHIANMNKYLFLLDEETSLLLDSINALRALFNLAGESRESVKKQYSRFASRYAAKGSSGLDELLVLKKPCYTEACAEAVLARLAALYISKADGIARYMDSTEVIVKDLYEKSLRHEELKELKISEKKKLNNAVYIKGKLLRKLRKDKKYFGRQLEQKVRSAKKLEKIIADLMKNEKAHSGGSIELPTGGLSWPAKSRIILRGFGEYTNSKTNTVFDNPGIDLYCRSGSAVFAAAEGLVSLVHWLPGYGSLIIIDHGSGVRTVYANLSSVGVTKGQKVKKGSSIGRTGESIDGTFLHFELWRGAGRRDPAKYLKRP